MLLTVALTSIWGPDRTCFKVKGAPEKGNILVDRGLLLSVGILEVTPPYFSG